MKRTRHNQPPTKRFPHNTAGFTMVELLVVVSLISLLASIVLASVSSAYSQARDAKRVGDMKSVQTALELYADDHGGKYPAPSDLPPDLGCSGEDYLGIYGTNRTGENCKLDAFLHPSSGTAYIANALFGGDPYFGSDFLSETYSLYGRQPSEPHLFSIVTYVENPTFAQQTGQWCVTNYGSDENAFCYSNY